MTATGDFKPYGVIYCITNTVNGKKYIGQTVQSVRARWSAHQNSDYCAALYRAIQKHGAEAFNVVEVASADSKEQLNELEVQFIRELKTTDRALGYNLREGGSFGKHTAESKQKMSEKVAAAYRRDPSIREKRRMQMLGSTQTEHARKKLRAANLGKQASAETKAKLAETRKALWATEAGERMRQASIAGRTSDEYKTKVADATKAQWQDPEKRERLKAAQAAGKAAFWADPEKRAARIAKRRATIEAKKAAQT
jgi:group I intron endonuclease